MNQEKIVLSDWAEDKKEKCKYEKTCNIKNTYKWDCSRNCPLFVEA